MRSLRTSDLDRIVIIVENRGADSAEQFIQEAVEAMLDEAVDVAAA